MLELTIRLVVSLMIVVGLLLVLARFGARRFRGGAGALVRVVHRQPLSRTSAVAVVTVGTRVLVLGTTEQQVTVLTELDHDELDELDLDGLEPVAPEEPAAVYLEAVPDEPPPVRAPKSHRASGATVIGSGAPLSGPLAGSVLSPQTWRQAYRAATGRRAG